MNTILSIWQTAVQNKRAVALYRMPGKQSFWAIVDPHQGIPIINGQLPEVTEPGFAASPFTIGEKGVFIRSGLLYNTVRGWLSENKLSESHKVVPAYDLLPFYEKINVQPLSHSQGYFEQMVERALEAIAEGHFQKVVPSRTLPVNLPEHFDILEAFKEATRRYPLAFVSLVHSPGIGTWLGATPETLVQLDNQDTFKTMALAGTRRLSANQSLEEVSWQQKEIEEQALVSRYIINCFKKIRLREFDEVGPHTVRAGNLAHLQTTFTVDTKETNRPDLLTVMLELLHPTSAVCGMPRQAAVTFLSTYEKHQRKLYSGWLGPVNVEKQTHLFVNLRCLEYGSTKALLYAGVGVLKGSNPQKEWLESEAKCQTLLSVIRASLGHQVV